MNVNLPFKSPRMLMINWRVLRALGNSHIKALIISQVLYWCDVAEQIADTPSDPRHDDFSAHHFGGHYWMWKSHLDMGYEIGFGKDAVKKATRELRELGIVVIESRQKPDGSPGPNWMRVDVDRLYQYILGAESGGGVKNTPGVGDKIPQGGVKNTPEEEDKEEDVKEHTPKRATESVSLYGDHAPAATSPTGKSKRPPRNERLRQQNQELQALPDDKPSASGPTDDGKSKLAEYIELQLGVGHKITVTGLRKLTSSKLHTYEGGEQMKAPSPEDLFLDPRWGHMFKAYVDDCVRVMKALLEAGKMPNNIGNKTVDMIVNFARNTKNPGWLVWKLNKDPDDYNPNSPNAAAKRQQAKKPKPQARVFTDQQDRILFKDGDENILVVDENGETLRPDLLEKIKSGKLK